MERRYPVLLHQFSLRKDSAGQGQHKGGEGTVREIEFQEPQVTRHRNLEVAWLTLLCCFAELPAPFYQSAVSIHLEA